MTPMKIAFFVGIGGLTLIWVMLVWLRLDLAFLILITGYATFNPWLRFEMTETGHFISLLDLWFGLLIIVFVLELFHEYRLSFAKASRSLLISIALFVSVVLLYPLIAIVLGRYPIGAITPGLRHLQWMLFFPVTAVMCRNTTTRRRLVTSVIALIVLTHTSYAILQYLEFYGFVNNLPHHRLEGHRQTWFYYGRATGLLLNPNHYGILMALCALVLATISTFNRQDAQRYGLYLSFAIGGILLSGSRTGLVMFMIPVTLCLFQIRFLLKNTIWFPIFAGPIIIVDTILGGKISSRFGQLASLFKGGFENIPHLAGRFEAWRAAIEVYRQQPVYGTLVASSIASDIITENYYLNLLIQAGPFGVLGILSVYLSSIRFGILTYTAESNPYSFALILVTIAIVIGNMTAYPMGLPPVTVLFWSLLGTVHSKTMELGGTDRVSNRRGDTSTS